MALGFDPRDSDLVLRPAWPLFVLNVIHSFVEDDSSYLSAFRTGEAWRIPAPSDAHVAWIRDPTGARHEVPVKDGRAMLFGEHAGIYELRAGSEDAPPTLFAANLTDPEESRIEPQKTLATFGDEAKPVTEFHAGVRREIWMALLGLAILLSVVEWTSYHRRITV